MKRTPNMPGPSCPLSHRIVAKTLFGIVRLLLLALASSLIYIAVTSR